MDWNDIFGSFDEPFDYGSHDDYTSRDDHYSCYAHRHYAGGGFSDSANIYRAVISLPRGVLPESVYDGCGDAVAYLAFKYGWGKPPRTRRSVFDHFARRPHGFHLEGLDPC